MFERRLRLLLALLGLAVVGLMLRLVQLQVVDAAEYQAQAQRLLLRDVEYFPCLRGKITDHSGKIALAYDAPEWSICVHYGVLAEDPSYLRSLVTTGYRGMDEEAASAALRRDIQTSWRTISELSGEPLEELEAVRQRILRSVRAIRRAVEKNRGVATPIREEFIPHAVVRGLDQVQQAVARERLRAYEWVSVVSDQRRLYAGGPAVAHLLGRLGEVSPEDVSTEHYADVPLGELYEYRAGDMKGISGLELMGERLLRGRRGRERRDRQGNLVNDPTPVEPLDGKDLRLTIDLPLQQRVYELLAAGVAQHPYCVGGAAVILDVPSREVLAVVSYPSFDPNASGEELLALEQDELRQPLLLRPLRTHYPPGSTVKPMLLAAALTDGIVTADTRVRCEGLLFPDYPDRWRCENHAHANVDPIYAIKHSCNVFFYHLGEQMTSPRIAWWMSQFGLGRESGAQFPLEATGNVPRRNDRGTARHAGIGQSQVDASPMQVANMMATIASGVYRPVTLWADDPRPRTPVRLPISEGAWRLVREGMYRVVNEPRGTGYERGRLTDAGDYILIGKTGTADGRRRPLPERIYTCHLPDGTTVEEVSTSQEALEKKYPGATVVRGRPAGYWPPQGVDPTHAWFAGYLTTRQRYLESSNGGRLSVAIAVILEYAGHGGDAAAPVARDMIRAVLERQGEGGGGTADQTDHGIQSGAPFAAAHASRGEGRR